MAWTQDADTGEWVWQDEVTDTERIGQVPVMRPEQAPVRTGEGSLLYKGASPIPLEKPRDENTDRDAERAWAKDVQARGSIVRYTKEGVFEIDPETRQVIDRMPTFYRMN